MLVKYIRNSIVAFLHVKTEYGEISQFLGGGGEGGAPFAARMRWDPLIIYGYLRSEPVTRCLRAVEIYRCHRNGVR